MQDLRQRVARLRFCPDEGSDSKQIQIQCCRGAALSVERSVERSQSGTSRRSAWGALAISGHLPLTAVNAAGFNPEKLGGDANGWGCGRNRGRRWIGGACRRDGNCLCRQARHRGRSGGRAEPWWPSLLVVRRIVSGG